MAPPSPARGLLTHWPSLTRPRRAPPRGRGFPRRLPLPGLTAPGRPHPRFSQGRVRGRAARCPVPAWGGQGGEGQEPRDGAQGLGRTGREKGGREGRPGEGEGRQGLAGEPPGGCWEFPRCPFSPFHPAATLPPLRGCRVLQPRGAPAGALGRTQLRFSAPRRRNRAPIQGHPAPSSSEPGRRPICQNASALCHVVTSAQHGGERGGQGDAGGSLRAPPAAGAQGGLAGQAKARPLLAAPGSLRAPLTACGLGSAGGVAGVPPLCIAALWARKMSVQTGTRRGAPLVLRTGCPILCQSEILRVRAPRAGAERQSFPGRTA